MGGFGGGEGGETGWGVIGGGEGLAGLEGGFGEDGGFGGVDGGNAVLSQACQSDAWHEWRAYCVASGSSGSLGPTR